MGRWKDDEHAPAWQVVRRATRYSESFTVDKKGKKTEIALLFDSPSNKSNLKPRRDGRAEVAQVRVDTPPERCESAESGGLENAGPRKQN
jgi:hypothetical protein